MKIVINNCFGGFALSREACNELGIKYKRWLGGHNLYDQHKMRTDPKLVDCVEKLGPRASEDAVSNLIVIEIPNDVDWYIRDDRGIETVEEKHRIWGGNADWGEWMGL